MKEPASSASALSADQGAAFSELRWECPAIPLIPAIPPSEMSGHVFSENWNRVGPDGGNPEICLGGGFLDYLDL